MWLWVVLVIVCFPESGVAGPPFKTDDPQPVDFLHWEFYLASQQQFAKYEAAVTLPHIEINFGAFRNVQIHLVAPMGYVRTDDGRAYGYSDTEIGVKYRFVEESDHSPQIGIFPMVEMPTGDKARQLGEGSVQVFLPIWLQKSWGKFTTYGGGGFWYNPGAQNRNWVFAGWQAQYDFSDAVTLGGELYYHSADKIDAESSAGFSVGGFINLNESSHLLLSVGRSLFGESVVTGYVGFQYTV
jgi:hypothetical protein